ncbi:Glycosyl transferase family 2 [Corynebacterium mustelae]|uniref:Glucosyl-3-phosphoglycerate synthase n=1 Tax=Corynebacterium mustelae TaxID=571915 RepID=A0A0G3GYA9_9CORY|nr:glucosyl-3-phosphoglycerate synthase [Corynebacterium mustelae]AKK05545.1 Glycosyl transferase family 2 [Corynebacterium mustelae]
MNPSISVVIPALNEEATIAKVITAIRANAPANLIEILVIDADSHDATAQRAVEAGATVYNWRKILPTIDVHPGKGESLWRGVAAAKGDIIVFIDADLNHVPPKIVEKLTAPYKNPEIALVKADYTRSFGSTPTGGGRVTELCAKPLLRALFPELCFINQPLGGEYAIRRSVATNLPFVGGYGVEIGLLIDVAHTHGTQAITQVPLGIRSHRNRPLEQLGPMAEVVATAILTRAGCRTQSQVFQRPALKSLSN